MSEKLMGSGVLVWRERVDEPGVFDLVDAESGESPADSDFDDTVMFSD